MAATKVHVGCGPKVHLNGWCNTDVRPFPGVDRVLDATEPWPFDSLTHVYGEHFLEHLEIDKAIDDWIEHEFLRHVRSGH